MRHISPILLAMGLAASSVCACIIKRGQTDVGYFDDADEVFVGHIVKTELQPFSKSECNKEMVASGFCNYVIGHFELVQTIKGTPPQHGEVREFISSPGMCSLGLLPGWYYVFYTKPKENRMVLYTEGSFPLGASYDEPAKQAVQSVRAQGHVRPKDGA